MSWYNPGSWFSKPESKTKEAGAISLSPKERKSYTGNAPVVVVPKNTSPSQAIERANRMGGGGGGGSHHVGEIIRSGGGGSHHYHGGGGSSSNSKQAKRQAEQKAQAKRQAEQKARQKVQQQSQQQKIALAQQQKNQSLINQMTQQGRRLIQNQNQFPTDSTIENYGIKKLNLPPIRTQPYIKKRVVGTFRDKDTGKFIPETKLVYVDPTGIGKQKERNVTAEERKYFNEQTNNLVIVPLTKKQKVAKKLGVLGQYEGITGSAIGGYEALNQDIKQSFTEPTLGQINFETAKKNIAETTKYLEESKYYPKFLADMGGGVANYGLSLTENTKNEPLKYVAIGGISAGLGLGVEAGISGATAISPTLGAGAKLLSTGAGIYYGGTYALDVGTNLIKAEDSYTKANILADATLTSASAIGGFKLGSKAYNKLSVIGKKYEPIELLVPEDVLSGKTKFVESKSYGYKGGGVSSKQKFDVEIFKKKGFGYHTSPERFSSNKIKEIGRASCRERV